MAIRWDPARDASRQAGWVLMTLGRELRIARYRAGLTQRAVGIAAGRSASWISLLESGKAPRVSVAELMVVASAVGLKVYVNAYPAGRRPLDAPQLRLLERFNARLHRGWRREMEKVMPREGDLRAVDELITLGTCTCAIEAITRLASIEAHVRAARAKQRDLEASRLILLIARTGANRRVLADAGPSLSRDFPVLTRQAMAKLAAGQDPGGDCLVVL
jgi:transcriptional regulator with XRE-family HTH domain